MESLSEAFGVTTAVRASDPDARSACGRWCPPSPEPPWDRACMRGLVLSVAESCVWL